MITDDQSIELLHDNRGAFLVFVNHIEHDDDDTPETRVKFVCGGCKACTLDALSSLMVSNEEFKELIMAACKNAGMIVFNELKLS